MPAENANNASKILHEARAYLRVSLPAGWQNYFSARRTGKYFGLTIRCPHCEQTAPDRVGPHQRWRWLAVHVSSQHK
jgi:hypothetical protein